MGLILINRESFSVEKNEEESSRAKDHEIEMTKRKCPTRLLLTFNVLLLTFGDILLTFGDILLTFGFILLILIFDF